MPTPCVLTSSCARLVAVNRLLSGGAGGGKPRGNEKQCRPGLTTPVPSCVRPQASGLPAAGAGLCQGRATSASPPQEGPEQVCSVGLGLAPGLASGGVWPGPGLR